MFYLLVELVVSGNWEVAHESFQLLDHLDELKGPQVPRARELIAKSLVDCREDWRKDLLRELDSMFD
jgi:hypothetical protein